MTLYLAIWGAAIGTFSFLWNVWKWQLERPCIVATIEGVESTWTAGNFSGVRLTIRNRGGSQTTVEEVFLYRPQGWLELGLGGALMRMRKDWVWTQYLSVSNPKTVKLPVVLSVNGVWDGWVPLEANEPDDDEELRQIGKNREIARVLPSGKLRYAIQCSHSNRKYHGSVRIRSF